MYVEYNLQNKNLRFLLPLPPPPCPWEVLPAPRDGSGGAEDARERGRRGGGDRRRMGRTDGGRVGGRSQKGVLMRRSGSSPE